MSGMLFVLFALVVSFAISVILCSLVIPFLRRLKFGQTILEEGPKWHEGKQGTPTMGGLCFILGSLMSMLIWIFLEYSGKLGRLGNFENGTLIPIALTFCLAAGNGIIGFADDYKKLIKKQK